MKKLENILSGIKVESLLGNHSLEISSIQFDSRKVTDNALFVAVKGIVSDGHHFINQAIDNGAVAIICEELPKNINSTITWILVNCSDEALALSAANFYNNPSKKLKLVGVTGTNGKTTTATLLYHLFTNLGYNTGLISTIENKIIDQTIPSTHTTPDALNLNKLLNEMLEKGCTHCFMEVSSHAIVQNRIKGIHFTGASFTNISHDHLDYHKTFDEYIKAKKLLFDGLEQSSFALTNIDDKRGMVMLQNTKAKKYTYSLKNDSNFKGKIITNTFDGLEININNHLAWFKLIGEFNAYNLINIYAIAVLLGEDESETLIHMSNLNTAEGRFHVLKKNNIIAIVDYAHTPDALENVLKTINEIRTGNEQLITIVGCGGNRDKEKRPKMAKIACEFSTRVILTSDNPRNESPEDILNDMKKGVSALNYKKTVAITDRAEAIKTAFLIANNGDIILIAGKGHEKYQEIKGVKHHFDDVEQINNIQEN